MPHSPRFPPLPPPPPPKRGRTKAKQDAKGRLCGKMPLEIDADELTRLLRTHATLQDIAGWFGCDRHTIALRIKAQFGKTFDELAQQGRARTAVQLRAKQIESALEGNPTMMIWLGKNLLGQRDKFDLAAAEGSTAPVLQIVMKTEDKGSGAD